MPAGPVEQQHGMRAWRHRLRNLRKMQGHGLRGATRQHESSAFAFGWTDRPEEGGGCGALIAWAMGRVPRFAQRRLIVFFWPRRALSHNQISSGRPCA